ncbi:MAG: hypothetical protein KA055_01900 [Aliarcobacter sp.]|nr:hypothetical protein [Aliarcobacter sp.]
MEIEKLKIKFDELISSITNPKTKKTLIDAKFDINELEEIISMYLENIESIEVRNINVIEPKISEMFQLSKGGLGANRLDEFITLYNFIKNKVPKNVEKKIDISKEEFTKRFNNWLNLLNLKKEKKSNFILSVDESEYEFYRTEDNNVLFVKIRESKTMFSPEYINLIELLNIVFKDEPGNTKIAKVISNRIIDNSIFYFFSKNDSSELLETIKSKLSKNENDLIIIKNEIEKIKIQEKELDDKKLEFNKIYEESKTAKEKYENTIKAAEKRAELGASVLYWEQKQEKHKKQFDTYKNLAIGFIIVLVLILGAVIYFEKSLRNNSSTNEIKHIKSELKVEKDKEGFKKELKPEIKKILEKKDDNSFLKDFENSNLPWYFLMIFASSSFFWIIRITVKIALSNLHLSEDAHERVVMIQTYLAFVKEGELKDENDKNLVLSPLFRPSNIGIIQDESSVTVSDIITAFKK